MRAHVYSIDKSTINKMVKKYSKKNNLREKNKKN